MDISLSSHTTPYSAAIYHTITTIISIISVKLGITKMRSLY